MTVLAVTLALIGTPTATTSYCLSGRMADGSYVRAGSVAHNGYPLGTRIYLEPAVFGRHRYVVRDRIGWGTELDVWHPSCAVSRAFGRRRVVVVRGWPRERLTRSRARVRARCWP